MSINRLGDELTRKIAAGEVIDRPASVVKELVENAIDAGSETVHVALVDGGGTSIVVRDDGEGIRHSELALAIERHTTSKISTEQDLDRILTLGFRGEALASIAAVSRMRIVSRAAGETEAFELVIEADALKTPVQPVGRGQGTTVEVSDLFFNLPARARFLGSPRTEYLHCSRVVQRFATLYPEVGWFLQHGTRETFAAPSTTGLIDRLGQVYGPEIARSLIPLEGSRGEITVSGAISRPDLRRSNRRDQLFTVNGRPVSDRGLAYVLASAYRGLLRPGAFPLAIVQIEIPAGDVDVNIHPRKEEVRFGNARKIQDAVSAAVHQALSSPQVVASALPADERTETSSPGAQVTEWPRSGTTGSAVRDSAQPPLTLDLRAETSRMRAVREAEKVRIRGDRRVIGQLHTTYLLVESPDGLEIVDQHIAHERILYERFRREMVEGDVARQLFLLPVRIELPFESAETLSGSLGLLAEHGIVLEEFGGGTFLLREYPRLLADPQTKKGFQEVIEALISALSESHSVDDVLHKHLASEMACGAAIRAGDHITLEEAQRLVERLMALENPYACPHGRPIIFSISKDDLDRKFKRK